MSVKTKICCISSAEEVDLAIRLGADVLGFVGEQPSGPGRLDDSVIAELIRHVRGRRPCWLLTSAVDESSLSSQIARTRPQVVQLCDHVEPAVYVALRKQFPELSIVQVVHVSEDGALERVQALGSLPDAILLDSGITSGPDRKLGGTGQTHDWRVSRRVVRAAAVPVWLAGGLSPANVETAIRQVKPAGVDLCSGVRDQQYLLKESLLSSFMEAVRRGSAPIQLEKGAPLAAYQRYIHSLEAMHDWLHLSMSDNGFLMMEELGELHAEIRRFEKAKQNGDAEAMAAHRGRAGEELVDVLNYLLAQANRLEIDLEHEFRAKNTKNQERSWD